MGIVGAINSNKSQLYPTGNSLICLLLCVVSHCLYWYLRVFTLRAICKEAKQEGANEYDAAIMFMLVQMNALEGNSSDVNSFIKNHSTNIKAIIDSASSTESEVLSLLSFIELKHGLNN